jgi:hypothetical protein
MRLPITALHSTAAEQTARPRVSGRRWAAEDKRLPMSPSEYEEYVEELVRQLEFGSELLVVRNPVLPGVRQPRDYEIDVAVPIVPGCSPSLGSALRRRTVARRSSD